jgi:type II secretory pathway component PulM
MANTASSPKLKQRLFLVSAVAAALFSVILILGILIPATERHRQQTQSEQSLAVQKISLSGTVKAEDLPYLYQVATALGLQVILDSPDHPNQR